MAAAVVVAVVRLVLVEALALLLTRLVLLSFHAPPTKLRAPSSPGNATWPRLPVIQARFEDDGGAYSHLHQTRPQTLG